MSLERNIAPTLYPISLPQLIDPKMLDTSFWAIEKESLSIFRLDIVFNNGGLNQSEPIKLHAVLCDLLLSGTSDRNALQLNDALDFYGAYISTSTSFYKSTLSVFGLKKYFKEILHLISSCVHDSIFPQDELDLLVQQRIDNLRIQKKKTAYTAQELMNSTWFDTSSPLTHITTEEDYEKLERKMLLDVFSTQFNSYHIFYTGSSLSAQEKALVSQSFPFLSKETNSPLLSPRQSDLTNSDKVRKQIMEESNQSTCLARLPFIGRTHPSFPAAAMLQLVFGGYFGSRLMKNIREEKGWTYGIMSQIKVYGKDCAFLQIHADIKSDKALAVLEEIKQEMQVLVQQQVSDEELERAKNYYLGNIGEMYESSTGLVDKFLMLQEEGLSLTWYNSFVEHIKKVTAKEIQVLAQKYFTADSLLYTWSGPE
jgi:zinc protease